MNNQSHAKLAATAIVRILLITGLIAHAVLARAEHSEPSSIKQSSEFLASFRPVIADVRQATVEVLADGHVVALGTVVDADGYVLTKSSDLTGPLACRLVSGDRIAARIVGIDREHDLAMLKIKAGRPLPAVSWNDNPEPRVGRWVVTAGPEELPRAVGIVSVASRPIPAERGVLGIALGKSEKGPRVTEVFPNSGAAKAGLEVGDLIVRAADEKIADGAALAAVIATYRPGDSLPLEVVRKREKLSLDARLGYSFPSLLSRGNLQEHLAGELSIRRAGFPRAVQHDSVLRPEECGGPLVDLDGNVVGINIARAGRTETYAIPAAVVVSLIDELRSGRLAPAEPQ